MPLRLVVTGAMFSLQLGFFYPPDSKAHCDKIKIAGDSHQVYEYSFERIERIGTTYLSVGSIPSQIYCVEYINANPELKKYIFSFRLQVIDCRNVKDRIKFRLAT